MNDLTPEDLREIRVSLGLSQRGMEQALRLKPRGGRGIREFETGERNPSGPLQYLYELFREGLVSTGRGARADLRATAESLMSDNPGTPPDK